MATRPPVFGAATWSAVFSRKLGHTMDTNTLLQPPAVSAVAYDDVVRGRRSIRGYKPDRVPKALVMEILEIAMRAPSSVNTQPWNFYVVSGAPLERIRDGNIENALAAPSSGVHNTYDGVHRERQIGIAKQLFGAMGIARDDKDKRQWWVLRGFRQFDAPVSIVVTYDQWVAGGQVAAFDCGGVTNALVNAAWARGLGCVINGQGTLHPEVLREHAQIPDDQVIMTCIAMGYPDDAFPANAVVSTRKSLQDAAVFLGFDD
jgi:nitroreductase